MSKDSNCVVIVRAVQGFAHLSCLVNFAQHKYRPGHTLFKPWKNCPNCLQEYQNEVAIELADKFVSFAENKYPNDKVAHVEARCLRFITISLH